MRTKALLSSTLLLAGAAGAGGAAGMDMSALLSALGGMGAAGGLGGLGAGFGAPAPPADPEAAYATQLQQLQEMGFFDRCAVRMLRHFPCVCVVGLPRAWAGQSAKLQACTVLVARLGWRAHGAGRFLHERLLTPCVPLAVVTGRPTSAR